MVMLGRARPFQALQPWRPASSVFPLSRRRGLQNPLESQNRRCALCSFYREMQILSQQVKKTSSPTVNSTTERPLQKNDRVGSFQKLPMVLPTSDILSMAQRKSRNIAPTKGITNYIKREKNRGAKQLDAFMKELAVPLRLYRENFPDKKRLHPYERSIIELTFGEGYYEKVLGRLDSLRKVVNSVGKKHASLCAKSSSATEAQEHLTLGMRELEEAFRLGEHDINNLIDIAKILRAMPVVDPQKPILSLVGSPNVGKSSLVRSLSTGTPEVCNYPFTTRKILMGHIVMKYETFQVTDTPGLLARHDDDRNDIEKLTIALLSHLPTAILYVHDISGDCGYSPDEQFFTYKQIKGKFGDRLWLDVVSKCDLLKEPQAPPPSVDLDDEFERYKRFGPDNAIRASVQRGIGVDELKQRVHRVLDSQLDLLRSMLDTEDGTDGAGTAISLPGS